MLTSFSNSRFTSVGADDTAWTMASNWASVRVSRFSAITSMAAATCSGVASADSTSTASSGDWGIVGIVVVVGVGMTVTAVKPVFGGTVATFAIKDDGEVNVVGGEVVVVGDGLKGTELVNSVGNSDDVVVDVEDDSDAGNVVSVVVELCSVELVEAGRLVVDVVVVGSGCVVVLLDDVGKTLVVDGSLVSGSLLVVVCHVVSVLLGSGSVVVTTSVVVVDTSVVVVVSSTVVVVCAVVGTTISAFASSSYCIPCRHASGLPQQTPARRRYQPGSTCTSSRDCNP